MNISCEFFPPRTQISTQSLKKTQQQLAIIKPEYYSVTFGASGTTQDATFEAIRQISSTSIPAAPHLSCIDAKKSEILTLLQKYQTLGIKKIVALRGDIPSGMHEIGEFSYAYQLVEFIKTNYPDFEIIVASYPETHPQASSNVADIDNFVTKIKAGANKSITQYFYNIDSFFYFRDSVAKRGVTATIIPGIMPITNYTKLLRFSNMCAAEIPRWILQNLKYHQNNSVELKKFGFEIVNQLCQKLKDQGVNDFHFYTMNKSNPSLQLSQNLI